MADNVTLTPAGTNPDGSAIAPAGPTMPTATSAPANAAAPTVEDLQRQLAASESQRKQGDENYKQLRSMHSRQDVELAAHRLRATTDQANAGKPVPTSAPVAAPPAPADKSQKTPNELLRDASVDFKLDNSDWKTYWPQMTEILDDQVRVAEVVVYTQTGEVDFPRSLQKAKELVVNSAITKAAAEGKEIAATAETNRATAKQATVISGSGASSVPETVDLEALRNDPVKLREVMVRHGLLDATDPPSFTKGGAQTKK